MRFRRPNEDSTLEISALIPRINSWADMQSRLKPTNQFPICL
jgi:hypothetical protein